MKMAYEKRYIGFIDVTRDIIKEKGLPEDSWEEATGHNSLGNDNRAFCIAKEIKPRGGRIWQGIYSHPKEGDPQPKNLFNKLDEVARWIVHNYQHEDYYSEQEIDPKKVPLPREERVVALPPFSELDMRFVRDPEKPYVIWDALKHFWKKDGANGYGSTLRDESGSYLANHYYIVLNGNQSQLGDIIDYLLDKRFSRYCHISDEDWWPRHREEYSEDRRIIKLGLELDVNCLLPKVLKEVREEQVKRVLLNNNIKATQ